MREDNRFTDRVGLELGLELGVELVWNWFRIGNFRRKLIPRAATLGTLPQGTNEQCNRSVVTICFAARAQTKKLEADFSFLPDVR